MAAAAEPDADAAADRALRSHPAAHRRVSRNSPCSTPSPAPAGALEAALSELARAASAAAEALPEEHRERPRAVALGAEAAAAARLLTDVTRVPPGDLVFWAELAGRRGGGPGARALVPARAWSLNCAPLSPAADRPRATLGPAAQRRAGQRHPRRGRLVCLLPRRSRPGRRARRARARVRLAVRLPAPGGARARARPRHPLRAPASSRRGSPRACGGSPSSPAAGCSPCLPTSARSRPSRS